MDIKKIDYKQNSMFPEDARNITLEEGAIILKGLPKNKLIGFLNDFGEIVPQYDGNPTFEISQNSHLEGIYHSRSTRSIPAHTDGHDLALPPHFFFLFCVKPSPSQDGFTEVSDAQKYLDSLSENELDCLEQYYLDYTSMPGEQAHDGQKSIFQIFNRESNIFRYSYNYLKNRAPEEMQDIIEGINQFHIQNKTSILLQPDELLICDNYRMLHSRTEFEDRDRHLIRAWDH